jgi:hypothetical protein
MSDDNDTRPKSPRELVERLEFYGKAVSALGGLNDLDWSLYAAAEMLTYYLDRDAARDAERTALTDPVSILQDASVRRGKE